jgi:hypothetical protein
MTCEQFRRLALSLPDVLEKEHMGHPDFRVAGKIFATVGYPDEHRAMVGLTPMEQEQFVHDYPEMFAPVKGGWGRRGATNVRLSAAKKPVVQQALQAAWQRIAPRKVSVSVSVPAKRRRSSHRTG